MDKENERVKYVRKLAEGYNLSGAYLERRIERLGGYLDGLDVAESTKLELHNLFFAIVDKKEGATPSSPCDGLMVRELDNNAEYIAELNRKHQPSPRDLEMARKFGENELKICNGKLYAGRSPFCECCGCFLTGCTCFGGQDEPDLTDEEITGKTAEQAMASLDSVGYKKGAV
jgi:hypothetical protein